MTMSEIPLALPGPAVVVLLGPAGSGKSTAARRLRPELPVVSSDACRAHISGDPYDQAATPDAVRLMHNLVRDHCQRRQSVVVDATNAGQAHRAALVAIARDHDMSAIAIVVDTPLRVCLARQTTRARPEPGKRCGERVPPEVVIQQHYAITHALPDLPGEGFTSIHCLRGDQLVDAPPALSLRLALARTDMGYSQTEVSQRTGIPRTGLSAMEHGHQTVSAEHLVQLARVYRRPVGWFCGEITTPTLPLDLTGLTHHQRDLIHRFVDFLRHDQLITCDAQKAGTRND
jgi:predicted kinase/transcriptional regulator with XRE-family HTH domain